MIGKHPKVKGAAKWIAIAGLSFGGATAVKTVTHTGPACCPPAVAGVHK